MICNARNPFVLIAASNASPRAKRSADYLCDGLDDQAEIQAAINALPTCGGMIRLSEGTFVLSWAGQITADTLTTPYSLLITPTVPAVTVAGVPGATVLRLANGQPANTAMLSLRGTGTAPRTNPTYLTGLTFDGNGANQPAWDNLADVSAVYASNVTIEACRFLGWKRNGFHAFRMSQKVIVANSHFLGEGALRLENHHYNVVGNIFQAVAATPGVSNVQLVPDYDVGYTIRLANLTANQFIGGAIQLEMNATQGCVVIGNSFCGQCDPNQPALIMNSNTAGRLDAKHNIVQGNSFYDCANGIWLMGSGDYGVQYSLVAQNSIMDGPNRNTAFGIRELGGTTGYNRILDNVLDPSIGTQVESCGVETVVRQ